MDTGTSQPAHNPYGGCAGKDPYGYDYINGNGGTFNSDKSKSESISGAFSWYGFRFSAQTGFTSYIYDDYYNGTSGNQQLCGTNYMPDVQILYNNTW